MRAFAAAFERMERVIIPNSKKNNLIWFTKVILTEKNRSQGNSDQPNFSNAREK